MYIKEIKNGRYKIQKSELDFDTEQDILTINAKSALEIAYTLFDMYGLSYKPLEELEEKMEK